MRSTVALAAAAAAGLGLTAAQAEERFTEARAVVSVRAGAPNAPARDARYSAVVDVEHYQAGRAASRFHAIDDRQCRWSAKAYIQRDVCEAGATAGSACDLTLSRRFAVSSPALPPQAAFPSPNCAVSRQAFASRLATLRADAAASLNPTMQADREPLTRELGVLQAATALGVQVPTPQTTARAADPAPQAAELVEAAR